ncbi:hypothetical protein [Nitrospira sp. Kam-Ns4a]
MLDVRIPVLTIALGWFLWAAPVLAGDQKVTLMLGGKFCDLYQGEIETALKKVVGVKAMDFKSMKGHVVVTVDGGKVKEKQLTDAVNAVKGEGWYCKAEVMR